MTFAGELAILRGTGDLLTHADIAERYGVTVHAVRNWRRRSPEFPAPWTTKSRVPLWRDVDVDAWAAATGRTQA